MSASTEHETGDAADQPMSGGLRRTYEIVGLTSQDVLGADIADLRSRLEHVGSDTTLVILDMQQISFVNSLFLSSLLALHTALMRRGTALGLLSPSPSVVQVLKLTRLDRIIPCGTLDEILHMTSIII